MSIIYNNKPVYTKQSKPYKILISQNPLDFIQDLQRFPQNHNSRVTFVSSSPGWFCISLIAIKKIVPEKKRLFASLRTMFKGKLYRCYVSHKSFMRKFALVATFDRREASVMVLGFN